MNKNRLAFAPRSWSPRMWPLVVGLCGPFRRRLHRRGLGLARVEVRDAAHFEAALKEGRRALVMPNHPSHADPFAIYEAAAQLRTPVHVMAAWHVFAKRSRLMRWCMCSHGCFSIDREANDLAALRNAIEILRTRPEPLVVFPEGEIYHCNDRVTPFREGAAAIALAAARKSDRPVVIVPTAIKYRYLDDPSDHIRSTLCELESRVLWRPTPDAPIVERIYRIGEAVLGLKELEYLGAAQPGALPERIRQLGEIVLNRMEERYGLAALDTFPKRVKELRRTILTELGVAALEPEAAQRLHHDLEDTFLVVQLYSYPGDYLQDPLPSIERIAETIDKLEEDVLQIATASIRGRREAIVQFAPPIEAPPTKSKTAAAELTVAAERQVQAMLDDLSRTRERSIREETRLQHRPRDSRSAG